MRQHLIILPGWGGSHETWAEFVSLIQDNFDVHVIDLPCFGAEPCPNSVWTVATYAEFVHKRMRELKADKYILLGHSFGGQVAAYVAYMYPSQISRLILVGASLYRPKKTFKRLFFWCIAKFGKLIFRLSIIEKADGWAKKILYKMADSPDYAHTSGIKRDIFKAIMREDLTAILPKIGVPTDLIWGEYDTYVPIRVARKAHAAIEGSTLHIIPEGSHGLHLTQKNALKQILLKLTA